MSPRSLRAPRWPHHDGAGNSHPLILLYHSVQRVRTDPFGVRVSPRHFAEHMAVLRAHANALPLIELVDRLKEGSLPARAVAITFDDGYADNLHHALPAMVRHGIPATVFVATGYVGGHREYWWDELDQLLLQPGRLPERIEIRLNGSLRQCLMARDRSYGLLAAWRNRRWRAWNDEAPTARHRAYRELWKSMQRSIPHDRDEALDELRRLIGAPLFARSTHRALTVTELKSLASSRLIEIGAHTVLHPSLGAMPVDVQRHEILASKAWLEKTLDRRITSFSYPFGTRSDYTDATVEVLKEAGFELTCSNFPDRIDSKTSRFEFPRRVVGDWSGREFAVKCAAWLAE